MDSFTVVNLSAIKQKLVDSTHSSSIGANGKFLLAHLVAVQNMGLRTATFAHLSCDAYG